MPICVFDRWLQFLCQSVCLTDRYSFYNEMGVIRDVFQNHLTQLLTLVTLDLPINMSSIPSAIEQAKVGAGDLFLFLNVCNKSFFKIGQLMDLRLYVLLF